MKVWKFGVCFLLCIDSAETKEYKDIEQQKQRQLMNWEVMFSAVQLGWAGREDKIAPSSARAGLFPPALCIVYVASSRKPFIPTFC